MLFALVRAGYKNLTRKVEPDKPFGFEKPHEGRFKNLPSPCLDKTIPLGA